MLLRFRGQAATQEYSNLRLPAGFGIPIPSLGAILHAVHAYKHLGATLQSNLSNMKFVMDRSSAGMSKYIPLAGKVFGADYLDATCKHSFARSLVDSAMLYMCQAKVLRTRELRKINASYMRVVRKIHGCSRFDSTAESDLEVREKHCIPSIDCLLLRKRLAYFSRIARSDCTLLKVLLSLRFDDSEMIYRAVGYKSNCESRHVYRTGFISAWVKLVVDDLVLAYKQFPCLLYERSLPTPSADTLHVWWKQAAESEKQECWSALCQQVFFTHSVCDRGQAPAEVVGTHVCEVCTQRFESSKALAAHCRAKHKVRSDAVRWAGADLTCGCCKVCFPLEPGWLLIFQMPGDRSVLCGFVRMRLHFRRQSNSG